MSRTLLRRICPGLVLGTLVLVMPAGAADKDAAVSTTPKVVKLDQLINAIKDQKGKVVVVDLWADG